MLKFTNLLLKFNPWKTILMFFTLVGFCIVFHLNRIKTPTKEVTQYLVGYYNDQIIVIYTGDQNTTHGVRGWEVKERYLTDVIKDNKLIITEHGYKYETWILTIFIISCVLLGSFIIICIVELTDGDGGLFNLEKVLHEYYYTKVEMIQEGEYFYYVIGDRLLSKDKSDNCNCYRSIQTYIDNKKLLPKWEGTTQDKRDKKLDDILSK
jgi:hypothetical protein